MKLRNLFLASVACAGLFTACSNEMDETIDNGGNGTNKAEAAYATFSLQMPAGMSQTRATAPETEVGTDAENKVSEVTLLFFNTADHSLTDNKTIALADLTPNANNTVYTTEALKVTKGTRFIYAFVNANAGIKNLAVGNTDAWKTITGTGTGTAADMSVADKFAMSNAEVAAPVQISYTKAEDAAKSPLGIKVERTVAKVTYTGTKTDFSINNSAGAPYATIQLQEIGLVNTNNAYYNLRRVSTDGSNPVIGGAEIDGINYVVDPNFTEKAPVNGMFGKTDYKAIGGSTFYCLENTMTKEAQLNGVTTGAMFKAQVTLAGETAATTFYRYNGMLYTDVAKVKALVGITGDFTESVENWSNKMVDYYKDGICYYPYWIKHVDNNNAKEMGIMEFGIVRNNVYKLAVSTISGIGAPTDKIDPENPDETTDAFISVKVEVKAWTVRKNENIEL